MSFPSLSPPSALSSQFCRCHFWVFFRLGTPNPLERCRETLFRRNTDEEWKGSEEGREERKAAVTVKDRICIALAASLYISMNILIYLFLYFLSKKMACWELSSLLLQASRWDEAINRCQHSHWLQAGLRILLPAITITDSRLLRSHQPLVLEVFPPWLLSRLHRLRDLFLPSLVLWHPMYLLSEHFCCP